MEPIDFVVTWVDGTDPQWLRQRKQFLPDGEKQCNRWRDWELMRYWFRSVEAYAPWVNKIWFVTWGHYPPWLNLAHPKLQVVCHQAYIPKSCLPTFNSNVIELHLHRIQQLSEQFVLFNDDMFLLRPVKPTDFFQKGMPCDTVRMGPVQALSGEDIFPHGVLNNCGVLNKHFSKREVLCRHWRKFFSCKYGSGLIRNLLLSPFRYFSGFYDLHLPTSHLKSTFREIWDLEPELMHRSASQRFRSREDVTHWLMKWWRFCQGRFIPRSIGWGRCFELGNDPNVSEVIRSRRYKAVCLNDSDPDLDFPRIQKDLTEAFEKILPRKSGFELW